MICEKCFCTASLIYVSLKFVSYVSYLIMYIGTSLRYFKNMLILSFLKSADLFLFSPTFLLYEMLTFPLYSCTQSLTDLQILFIYLLFLQNVYYEIFSCHKSPVQKVISFYIAVRLNNEYTIPGSCRSHQIVYTQVMKILVILYTQLDNIIVTPYSVLYKM